ncbi:MAG: HAD family hydrolase [Clostridia bacterium]|nr:HAD family hydrolase [Clostridia bacterium]
MQDMQTLAATHFSMEVIAPPTGRTFKAALFDFDGTLSLIREGWREDMIPYFCEELAATPGGKNETAQEIYDCAAEFVDALTGKQTIFQCMKLAEEVEKRGGVAKDPMEYKTEYLRRLMARIDGKREALAKGEIEPESQLVTGSYAVLQGLLDRGVGIYCASGTDQPQVREEAGLLQLQSFFGEHIYGALDEHAQQCSKEVVLKTLLEKNGIKGEELLSFGDGPVEIDLVAKLGGYAVAVATDEQKKYGINPVKREKLLAAGASVVIPDFSKPEELLNFLFGE